MERPALPCVSHVHVRAYSKYADALCVTTRTWHIADRSIPRSCLRTGGCSVDRGLSAVPRCCATAAVSTAQLWIRVHTLPWCATFASAHGSVRPCKHVRLRPMHTHTSSLALLQVDWRSPRQMNAMVHIFEPGDFMLHFAGTGK